MTTTFAAKYGGPCSADCGERIRKGDEAAYIDGKLYHPECATLGDMPERPLTFCPECWLATPCGCEE